MSGEVPLFFLVWVQWRRLTWRACRSASAAAVSSPFFRAIRIALSRPLVSE
jgi:hypothetical protein